MTPINEHDYAQIGKWMVAIDLLHDDSTTAATLAPMLRMSEETLLHWARTDGAELGLHWAYPSEDWPGDEDR